MKSSNRPVLPQEPKALAHDPFSQDEILTDFYRPKAKGTNAPEIQPAKTEKPNHYKIVCLSLYNEDIEKLNALVAELKKRGHSKANKSQVVRAALEQLDISRVPKIR